MIGLFFYFTDNELGGRNSAWFATLFDIGAIVGKKLA